MLNKFFLSWLIVTLVGIQAGCYRVGLSPNMGPETIVVDTLSHTELLSVETGTTPESHRFSRTAWWLLWFVPWNHPDLVNDVRKTMPPGKVMVNPRLKISKPWFGYPLFMITLGAVNAQRIEMTFESALADRSTSFDQIELIRLLTLMESIGVDARVVSSTDVVILELSGVEDFPDWEETLFFGFEVKVSYRVMDVEEEEVKWLVVLEKDPTPGGS